MKVKYLGNSSFLFKSKQAKLITNPTDQGLKINIKKVDPDIVVLSHKAQVAANDYYLISSPGEFEVKEIFVYGYASTLEDGKGEIADIYMFDIENVHLCIIDKSVKNVRGSVLDELGIVDVLFVSLAEEAGMKFSKITDLVNKIEPYILIPMDYTQKTLADFTKTLGVQEVEKMETVLDVKKSDFSEEEVSMRFVVLEK